MKTKVLALAVPFTLLITLYFNYLAATGQINGIATGDISELYPVLFTPAGYVFSIWSLIYLSLICFSIYQLLPDNFSKPQLNRLRILVIFNLLLNSTWIILWQYQYLLPSLLIMILLLINLITVYLSVQKQSYTSLIQKFCLKWPFSLYLGWISVATIANTSVVLYSLNWNQFGLSDVFWTSTMIIIAAILAVILQWKYRDFVFSGVIVWAIIGITLKHPQIYQIRLAVLGSILTLLASSVYLTFQLQKEKKA